MCCIPQAQAPDKDCAHLLTTLCLGVSMPESSPMQDVDEGDAGWVPCRESASPVLVRAASGLCPGRWRCD